MHTGQPQPHMSVTPPPSRHGASVSQPCLDRRHMLVGGVAGTAILWLPAPACAGARHASHTGRDRSPSLALLGQPAAGAGVSPPPDCRLSPRHEESSRAWRSPVAGLQDGRTLGTALA